MTQTPGQVYEFGPFHLDTEEHLLLRNDVAVSITPKAFETLCALIEHSGRVVSKDDLMSRVWPDTYVEETNLAQNISTLRKALGERPDGGQYIETVPKRGYRFVAKVSKVASRDVVQEVARQQVENQPTTDLSPLIPPAEERRGQQTVAEKLRTTGARSDKITAGMRLGHYEIIANIGAGGMGEVYLARDTRLDRRVALKLLSKRFTQDDRSLQRFIREAKAVSALNHPNILTLYEIREVDGINFIATEFIEGATIRQLLRNGPFPPLVALDAIIQVAGALAAAHAAGVIHRDIKPENIMIRPDWYVKVLDFGVAKLINPLHALPDGERAYTGPETDSGLILGTVDYMSPEQARGLSVDARSDLFSLGAVLYEMVTGHAPFSGETKSDVLINVIQRTPPSALLVAPAIGEALGALIERCMHKDRNNRVESAEKLHAELKKIRQDIETSTRRTSGSTEAASLNHSYATPKRAPEVHYASSGDVNIAYQVVGDAPVDLVFVMGWVSHLEYFWADPLFARFLNRLASFSRLIIFDKRGTGLSDRVPLSGLPTLEQRMDDVRAVMDAVGSEHAVLCGVSEGGPLCSLFAATYPEKVTALVMIGSYAKRIWAPDYPWAPTTEQREHFFEEIRREWGGPVGIEERAPSLAHDERFRDWWATYLRMGASPGAALALTQMNAEIDVRPVLRSIRVPTLILHRTGDLCLKIEEARFIADTIPGAKLVELPGLDHLPFVGDQESILEEIEEFVTGVRHSSERDTVLATVLATEVFDAANQEKALGTERWRDLLGRLDEHIKREISLFKGREVDHEDGRALATFDGPARAIRAASAINEAARRLGIRFQAGLHTGECEVFGDQIGGLAVAISRQVAHHAAIGEVLVSSTVKDLVAGSGIAFEDHGQHSLAGVPGEWRLFKVVR